MNQSVLLEHPKALEIEKFVSKNVMIVMVVRSAYPTTNQAIATIKHKQNYLQIGDYKLYNSGMGTYVRAVVTEDEKQSVNEICRKLGLNESTLIRAGLAKMGVTITVTKTCGPITPEYTQEFRANVIADYSNGSSWKELMEKYSLNIRALDNILGVHKNKRKRKPAAN